MPFPTYNRYTRFNDDFLNGTIPNLGAYYTSNQYGNLVRRKEWGFAESDEYYYVQLVNSGDIPYTVYKINRNNAERHNITVNHIKYVIQKHNENLMIGMSDEEFNRIRKDELKSYCRFN